MSDDLVDDSVYAIQFPMWIFIHPQAKTTFLTVNGPNGELSYPVFTDDDLADRYIADYQQLAHYVRGMVENAEQLLPLLDMLEKRDYTHVAIDSTGKRAAFYPIDRLRECSLHDRLARITICAYRPPEDLPVVSIVYLTKDGESPVEFPP